MLSLFVPRQQTRYSTAQHNILFVAFALVRKWTVESTSINSEKNMVKEQLLSSLLLLHLMTLKTTFANVVSQKITCVLKTSITKTGNQQDGMEQNAHGIRHVHGVTSKYKFCNRL